MRTELPAERLHRRLHPPEEEVPADDDDDDDPPDTTLSRWLPDNGPDTEPGWMAAIRADPGRAGVIALAAVGVIAVLVTVFTLMRDTPTPVASADLPPVQMVSSASPTPSGTAAPNEPVVVSVVGLVHEPGLVTLSNGSRIADALSAAGGALDGADLIGLNMARRVTDGEQILVGIAAPPGEPPVMGSSVSTDSSDSPGGTSTSTSTDTGTDSAAPVNLNTATVEELETLPGVGPVTAAAIIEWREANGKFSSVDQLNDVDGIGPARMEKLRERVTV